MSQGWTSVKALNIIPQINLKLKTRLNLESLREFWSDFVNSFLQHLIFDVSKKRKL